MSIGGQQRSAYSNMAWGAVWCVGGIIVTLGSLAAANGGGRTYVVAWGAILFGGIQFVQGLIQLGAGSAATPAAPLPEKVAFPASPNSSERVRKCLAALQHLGCHVSATGAEQWEVEVPGAGKRLAYDQEQLEALTTELIRARQPG